MTPKQNVGPALLLPTVLIVSKTGVLLLDEVLGYELSPFPAVLFKIRNVFCKPDKAKLSHSITGHSKEVGVDQP